MLCDELKRFDVWSTSLINTTRSETWTKSVQSTSMEKTLQVLRGYLGFCHHLRDVPLADLSLSAYLDPSHVAMFLSFLQDRGAGREQIIKQITVARKVADFLRAESRGDVDTTEHVAALDQWLQRLSAQLSASMPPPELPNLPKNHALRLWAETGLLRALQQAREDIRVFGCITRRTAIKLEQACLVATCVGVALPPLRLDFAKTVLHPQFNHLGCQDPDCLSTACGRWCPGNRITVHGCDALGDRSPTESEEEEEEAIWEKGGPSSRRVDPLAPASVTIHIVHGKNDRRSCRSKYNVSVKVPPGPYRDCLVLWTLEGRPLLTQHNGDGPKAANRRLFVTTHAGTAFNHTTFDHFWHKAMRDTRAGDFGILPFPPSQARKSFVEAFTEMGGGAEPEFFEGASAIMGNCEDQWKATYNPSRRQRQADATMWAYDQFSERQRSLSKRENGASGSD